jgi:hypothetical protein
MDKKLELLNDYENRLLDILEHKDEMTQSDLQGCISAELMSFAREVQIATCNNEIKCTCPKCLPF